MPKKENVEKMFDSIAPEYDALNHILSLNIDKLWRKRAVRELCKKDDECDILDIACGTGDFTIAIANWCPKSRITGIDLSEQMLESGRKKLAQKGLQNRTDYRKGDCANMEFADNSFDGISVGFGVRNFEDKELCLKEMSRVLKPGARLVILELSIPSNPILRALYKFYFLKVLPFIGGAVSGDKAAYRYLPASVLKFPAPDEFCKMLSECGFTQVRHKALTFGICRMFTAVKA